MGEYFTLDESRWPFSPSILSQTEVVTNNQLDDEYISTFLNKNVDSSRPGMEYGIHSYKVRSPVNLRYNSTKLKEGKPQLECSWNKMKPLTREMHSMTNWFNQRLKTTYSNTNLCSKYSKPACLIVKDLQKEIHNKRKHMKSSHSVSSFNDIKFGNKEGVKKVLHKQTQSITTKSKLPMLQVNSGSRQLQEHIIMNPGKEFNLIQERRTVTNFGNLKENAGTSSQFFRKNAKNYFFSLEMFDDMKEEDSIYNFKQILNSSSNDVLALTKYIYIYILFI